MPIALPAKTRQDLVASIAAYFRDERDERIGDLQAGFLLDFCLREIGPSIYNQALADAQAHLHGTVDDLAGTLHEPEFGYSTEQRTRRRTGR